MKETIDKIKLLLITCSFPKPDRYSPVTVNRNNVTVSSDDVTVTGNKVMVFCPAMRTVTALSCEKYLELRK
jgi:hypothetical protein